MDALKLKDFLNYKYLSAVEYAPGGARAAFVVTTADEENNSYERRLYLYDGEIRQLTDLGKEGGFTWLDDHRLLFPAVRSAKEKKRAEAHEAFTSYYCLDVSAPGEALPAFTLPFAGLGMKVLDGTHFAVVGAYSEKAPDYYAMNDEERAKVAADMAAEKDYEVFTEIPFWGNGAGVTQGRRTALFLVETDTMKITRVSAAGETLHGMEVVGDEVVFAAALRTPKPDLYSCDIRAVNWKTGETRTVREVRGLSVSDLTRVGDALWVAATDGKRHGLNENSWLYTLDLATGELAELRREEYSLYGSVGSDCRLGGGKEQGVKGGSLYTVTTREGDALMVRIDADGSSTPVITKPGSIDCFTLCEESDTALAVAMYDMKLQELYALDLKTGEATQLSHFNDAALAGKYVAQPEYLECVSEGLTIGGWVLPPKEYDPEKTYPAVFDIHGGPKTAYGPVFYHEMQLWANMGCFVFFCNPKGSDGRDNDFADIRGHYGETDYKNLMDFADAVLAKYPAIDPARVCETGGSYGGFMTNWIIGHTDRFCCTATQRSISNWLSFYGVSDIGFYFAADQCDGDPFTSPERLWNQSPLKYAANVKTPTLFIHSDEDYRCPLEQGLQMYTALVEHGVPARLCMFHGENHELSRGGKPQHRVRRLKEITDWFCKYAAIPAEE